MDKSEKQLFGKAIEAAMKFDKCGKAKCKEEYKATVEEHKVMMGKLEELNKKLVDKSITYKMYSDKSRKILEEMKGTTVKMAMLSCSLKECKSSVSNTLHVLGDILANECKKENKKKSCSTEKKVRALAKAKEITPKEFIKVREAARN
jgi:hypothetical protein